MRLPSGWGHAYVVGCWAIRYALPTDCDNSGSLQVVVVQSSRRRIQDIEVLQVLAELIDLVCPLAPTVNETGHEDQGAMC